MLSKIRKNMRVFSLPLWIVAASFVGTIFLVWGRGSVGGPSANEVATVNGKPIDLIEFNMEYNILVKELKNRFGESYNKQFPDKEIKRAALQRLVNEELLIQEAQRLGIKVSDWAVAKEIKSLPFLQKNGKFSENLYYQYLESQRLTPKVFEEKIRRILLIEKLLTLVNNSPSVTQTELENLYRKTFGKREFKYKIFRLSDFKVKVSKKEVENYYNQHKELFKEKTAEKAFVVKVSKSQKDAKEFAKKLYSLAKEGKTEELLKFSPSEVKDKNILEKFKDKNFGFWNDDNFFYILFKKDGETVIKPLEDVYQIVKAMVKEEKASKIAKKEAERWLKEKKSLTSKTSLLSKEEFFNKFKPLDLEGIENLFKAPKGKRILVSLADGFGIFEPITELKVDKIDKDKMDRLKEFVLNTKAESNYENLLNILRQKATIKINEKFFK